MDRQELKLTSHKKEEITYHIYKYRTTDHESDWASFLPAELKDEVGFHQSKMNLVLFIETEQELFAIVGGAAYWIIANYIDHLFGLVTYDRIISLDEDEALSTKSRGMTGQRVGLTEQFRDNYRIINYLQFGKVPKEIHVKLSAATAVLHFPFLLQKPSERLHLAVGKGFKINKEVNFDTLHQITTELTTIISLAPKDFLSSYIQVQDKADLDMLSDLLLTKIYNNIPNILGQSNDPRNDFEFDFCNPNKIEEFYEAERYELVEKAEGAGRKAGLFATLDNKGEIYRTVIERAYQLHGNNQRSIQYYLYGVNVRCYVGRRQTATSGFMFHFNAEFSHKDEAVFLVDGKWYRLKDPFIKSLAAQTERILRSSKLDSSILDLPWTFDIANMKFTKEGSYNLLYDRRPDYLVLDTIIADGIELCDILHIRNNEIYLIHVKHSFTSRVRELTNQILISARRLREAISSRQQGFFDQLYDSLVAKNRSVSGLTKTDFYALFLTKKPIYVFATASQLATDLAIEDHMDKYDSNIARFSLTICSAEMQTNFYELRTFQIKRA